MVGIVVVARPVVTMAEVQVVVDLVANMVAGEAGARAGTRVVAAMEELQVVATKVEVKEASVRVATRVAAATGVEGMVVTLGGVKVAVAGAVAIGGVAAVALKANRR